jgi:hypothetical protein
MAPKGPNSTPSEPIPAIVAELGRMEEGALYYEESHRQDASFWGRVSLALGFGAAGTAAATVALNLPKDPAESWVGAFALITAILASGNAFFKPAEREAAHLSATTGFNSLRVALRRCRVVSSHVLDAGALSAQLEELSGRREELLRAAPRASERAFEKARKKIADGVFEYRVDLEST